MTERPDPLVRLDSYFAAARIAHEYAYDLHRELVELDAANDHTRELLNESAAITLERLPALTSSLQDLEHEWAEQELLDPQAAQRTAERLESSLAAVTPQLATLRARQDQIIAELLDLLGRARS
jgi:hypothetical protein